MKFWMKFFMGPFTFNYIFKKQKQSLSRALGPYLHKFNNFIALEIFRVSTIFHLSTILSKESAPQRIFLDFCTF